MFSLHTMHSLLNLRPPYQVIFSVGSFGCATLLRTYDLSIGTTWLRVCDALQLNGNKAVICSTQLLPFLIMVQLSLGPTDTLHAALGQAEDGSCKLLCPHSPSDTSKRAQADALGPAVCITHASSSDPP